jgi:hypothetical protein
MAERTGALARPDHLSTLNSWAWIDATRDGLVAFMLVAPGTTDVTATDITALAGALGLAEPGELMPSIGPRVDLCEMISTVHIPEIGRSLSMQVTNEWGSLVRQGGTIVLLLGTDLLPTSAALTDIRAYIAEGVEAGQIRSGKTSRKLSQQQAELSACLVCERGERPLHPGPAVPVGQDVVQETVICTSCLTVGGIAQ